MGWADRYASALMSGETAIFRPYGNSMEPKIKSGQLVTVTPKSPADIVVGDIVLCRVRGKQYLHYVKAKRLEADRHMFMIANASGLENGWTGVVYGVLTEIEP